MGDKNINSSENDEVKDKIRKRRFSACNQSKKDEASDGESPERKFRLIAPAQFRLLDFSDEVLFEIFKYLDTWTLMALMNCCSRLGSLILDHRFWNYIDLSKEPLPLGILEDVLERSQGNTTCIKLHGPPVAQHLEREDKRFNQTIAKAFKNCCTNLTILELQGITIDFRYVRITDFPTSIKRLLLNDCNVKFEGEKSIFFGIDTHLTKLEELAIENSNWFEPYYMMVFSKVPELRSLSLKGCQLLSDFVPYGSMAARFGFKKLEYLDLRFTPISDSDIQCFNAVATLKEVLLDCPESLRENNTEVQQDTKIKIRNCYCHSRPNCETNNSNDINNESPSTSNASRLRITVSISPGGNDNGPSTSAAAAAQQSQSQSQATTPQQQQDQQAASGREEDSSTSSCSSSPSSSSTSSNESLPPLLGNQARHMPPNPIELPIELPIPGGNVPPFSRFLPRPDQIILLDLNNRWRRVVMQNAALNHAIGDNVGDGGGDERQQNQQQQQPQQVGELQQQAEPQQNHRQQGPQERLQQREQQIRVLLRQQQQQLQQQIIDIQQHRQNRNQNNNNNNNNINNNHINNNNNDNNGNHNNNNHNNNANQIEQVLNHPLFWDMINPFARVGRPRRSIRGGGVGGAGGGDDADADDVPRVFDFRRSQCSGQYHQYHRHRHRSHHHPISDRGICCFGRPRNPVEHGIIWIRIGNRPSENRFERLSIRNYKLVTDVSLQHLVQCSPYLVYLDLSGTGVTRRGIEAFKERKPQCVIVADHLIDDSSTNKPSCSGECTDIQDTI